MLTIALLFIAVMFVLVPWANKMQKRRSEEWRERRKRLLAIGDDDDDASHASSVATKRTSELKAGTPPESNLETGNPYQPPRVSRRRIR